MRNVFLILFLAGLSFNTVCIFANSSDLTLTEMLFKGVSDQTTIFSCKILSNQTIKNEKNNSLKKILIRAEIIEVYFGKIDSNIVTLKTNNYEYFVPQFDFEVGKKYLIFSENNKNTFRITTFKRFTCQITENPDSTYEITILNQFAHIFKNKTTGLFSFKNSKGIVLATGEYDQGVPVKIWKHYYDNGIIKAEYDLENNITSQFSKKGIIQSRVTLKKNENISENFSPQGILIDKTVSTKSDIKEVKKIYSYNSKSGKLKNVQTFYTPITSYEEYYENGTLKLTGQYINNQKAGVWKNYDEFGDLISETEYNEEDNKFHTNKIKNYQCLKYIPDINLRNALKKLRYLTNDSLDLSKIYRVGLYLQGTNIENLEGLQYFTSVQSLNISDNKIKQLDHLPSNLTELNCSGNKLTKIEKLPIKLKRLDCRNNQITAIDNLPNPLEYLNFGNNQMKRLPILPDGWLQDINIMYPKIRTES